MANVQLYHFHAVKIMLIQHCKPAFILRRTYNGGCGIVYQLKRIPSAVARVVLRGDNVAFVAAFSKAVCVAVTTRPTPSTMGRKLSLNCPIRIAYTPVEMIYYT